MTPQRLPRIHHLCSLSLLIVLLFIGCSSGDAARKDTAGSDELIGAPPSSDQDPFASQALPPESARAPTSGMMDIRDSASLPEDRAQTPRPALAQPASPSKEELLEEAARNAPSPEPTPEKELPVVEKPEEIAMTEPAPPVVEREVDDVHRCFSCVRICPVSDDSGDCSNSKEDMICGWGTAMNALEATTLARAQCNAALDMAREMPRFSRIDGACPVASCME